MNRAANLDALSPDELRTLAAQMAKIGEKDRDSRASYEPLTDPARDEQAFYAITTCDFCAASSAQVAAPDRPVRSSAFR
ncbi:hypothetical protein WI89_11095 [Burkholderia ubonensis]|uniref:hypothetical protein n=1 Tax=Burkholderia ubonensis TaxID=101571 RepID=UPI000770CBB3|nr:hypothetical protein [Burkholderia ubonensis]KVD74291.1 hypothetical protein WI89_11095 [Burkholderia ubonensis]